MAKTAERTASTTWEGDLPKGRGTVTVSSGAIGDFPVTWASRTERSDGKTSPEELIAAAHSSCFSMALSSEIGKAGGTTESLEVTAEVTLGAGAITKIALTVRGEVTGLDADGFEKAAQAAKVGCPVSKALAGVDEITLDAALA